METVKLKLRDITPYEKNAKKHDKTQIENVMKSIRKFGFVQPIVVDSQNEIIIGHCRYEAAKKLDMDEIDCVIAKDLDPKDVKKLRLLDNKLNESEWDLDNLIFDMDDLDFSEFDVDWELPDITEDKELIEDEAPECPGKAASKPGDIYILGDHRLMCADATDKDAVIKLLEGNTPDLLLTDPPYGINVVGEEGTIGKDNLAKTGTYSPVIGDETTDTARKSYEVCKELTNKQIIFGGNYFMDFLSGSDGWIIWDKRADSGIRNNFADGEMAWCSFHTPVRIYHQLWAGMIREGEHEKRVHPTQKPVRMFGEIINDFTDPDSVILDVFGGSGSTLIACEQTNRKCFMMEIDPLYVDVIVKRWENFTGKKAILQQLSKEEELWQDHEKR